MKQVTHIQKQVSYGSQTTKCKCELRNEVLKSWPDGSSFQSLVHIVR